MKCVHLKSGITDANENAGIGAVAMLPWHCRGLADDFAHETWARMHADFVRVIT